MVLTWRSSRSSSASGRAADPKDEIFLELAVTGEASVIVTGDDDLLALHPFRGIDILRPTAYLDGMTIAESSGRTGLSRCRAAAA